MMCAIAVEESPLKVFGKKLEAPQFDVEKLKPHCAQMHQQPEGELYPAEAKVVEKTLGKSKAEIRHTWLKALFPHASVAIFQKYVEMETPPICLAFLNGSGETLRNICGNCVCFKDVRSDCGGSGTVSFRDLSLAGQQLAVSGLGGIIGGLGQMPAPPSIFINDSVSAREPSSDKKPEKLKGKSLSFTMAEAKTLPTLESPPCPTMPERVRKSLKEAEELVEGGEPVLIYETKDWKEVQRDPIAGLIVDEMFYAVGFWDVGETEAEIMNKLNPAML